ncbi:ribokinase [Paracoccus isoporae]|uniref:Ribokinase n=1 Tax=Paracoccus isoporae TaxID=591205 RepID=A0A1G6TCB1_9RHOB|nr:ribokinase [Paracoccus isoporae]SDD26186.1 ribokinase [Paracoccus isoporae]
MTIYNLGSINIDHVYRLDHMPAPGETLSSQEFSQGLGGKGANQSIAAARAGAEVVHIGAISGDGDDWVIERLAGAGVDTGQIARLDGIATGHAIIYVDGAGENAIVLHPGANMRLERDRLTRALSGIGARDTLLIQNETNLQAEAAQIARAAGARVIYSAAPFGIEAVRAVIGQVSMLALNRIEAEQLAAATGGGVDVPAMLVTRGGEGAEFRDLATGEVIRQDAFEVEPVDTTGAGDCFAGYVAAGLDLGRDMRTALRHAAAAAAIKVTRVGAGDAIPDAAEVEAFLAARG